MNRPKCTPEFAAKVEFLIEKELMKKWDGGASRISQIIEILRNNTTDNPDIVEQRDETILRIDRE